MNFYSTSSLIDRINIDIGVVGINICVLIDCLSKQVIKLFINQGCYTVRKRIRNFYIRISFVYQIETPRMQDLYLCLSVLFSHTFVSHSTTTYLTSFYSSVPYRCLSLSFLTMKSILPLFPFLRISYILISGFTFLFSKFIIVTLLVWFIFFVGL